MTVTISDATAAYKRALSGDGPLGDGQLGDGQLGLEARGGGEGGGFAGLLRRAAEDSVELLRQGESESLKAAAGKADITDVVTAVGQAEITLQTVVAVRDRVIQAYQEILRMPI